MKLIEPLFALGRVTPKIGEKSRSADDADYGFDNCTQGESKQISRNNSVRLQKKSSTFNREGRT